MLSSDKNVTRNKCMHQLRHACYLCSSCGHVEGRILISSFLVIRQSLSPNDAIRWFRHVTRGLSNSKSFSFHPKPKLGIFHRITLLSSQGSQNSSIFPQGNSLSLCRITISLYYPGLIICVHVLFRATSTIGDMWVILVVSPAFVIWLLSIFICFYLGCRPSLVCLCWWFHGRNH